MFKFKQIDKFVQRSLYNRIDSLNRENSFSALEPMQAGFNSMDFLTNTCWARVTSGIFETDGDGKKTNELFRLSSAFKDGQPINKPLASQTDFLIMIRMIYLDYQYTINHHSIQIKLWFTRSGY